MTDDFSYLPVRVPETQRNWPLLTYVLDGDMTWREDIYHMGWFPIYNLTQAPILFTIEKGIMKENKNQLYIWVLAV